MGPGIIIPVVVLAVLVPVGLSLAKRKLKDPTGGGTPFADAPDSSARLTSDALRTLASPPWRVVHEIAAHRLGGIDHVVVGPPGVLPIVTSIEALPFGPFEHDPTAVAAAAVRRSELDDALRRCAMSTDRLVNVHWGVNPQPEITSTEPLKGVVAVDGRALVAWLQSLDATELSPAQVDLAWSTVLTKIGRPNPLD